MCSAFTPNCGYDNSTFIFIGDVFCPITKCSGKPCLHEKTFQSLGRNSYRCSQCVSVCEVHKIPFGDQTNSFFFSLGQAVYTFEATPKSNQNGIGDVFCPGRYCFNRKKRKPYDGYVTTPRSCHGCGKCGAWLFVHKVRFTLQVLVKTTKTEKLPFFANKDERGTRQRTSVH